MCVAQTTSLLSPQHFSLRIGGACTVQSLLNDCHRMPLTSVTVFIVR